MDFDVTLALSLVPGLLWAAATTLAIAIGSSAIAAVVGFLGEILRRSVPMLRRPINFAIDFLRCTPFLAQLYFFYFVLPFYGIKLPAIVIGVGALGLYFSSYLAEVFRAGIDSVPVSQVEAARALGLKRFRIVRFVLLPQVARHVAPAMGSYFISLLKATPYLAVIAIPEMLGQALDYASVTFRYYEPILVVGAMFLILSLGLGHIFRKLEYRLALPHATK
jgi:polar amino acid transport system permease protein